MLGSAVCAGFGAQTPWYNQTGMSAGWAHELAAVLHQDYGHEVLNVAKSVMRTGDIANKHFEQTAAPLQSDVVVIAFSLGNEGLMMAQNETAAQKCCNSFMEGIRELVTSLSQSGPCQWCASAILSNGSTQCITQR